jgi:hypothetical protein
MHLAVTAQPKFVEHYSQFNHLSGRVFGRIFMDKGVYETNLPVVSRSAFLPFRH